MGCHLWGHKESDTTKQLTQHNNNMPISLRKRMQGTSLVIQRLRLYTSCRGHRNWELRSHTPHGTAKKKNACKPSSAVPGAQKCCRDSKYNSCPLYALLASSDLCTPKPSQSQVVGSHQQPPHLCAHIHVHTHRRKDQVKSNLSRFISSAEWQETVVLERMFPEKLTSSSFCLRVSAVRSTASQNLHLIPFPLPHPHLALQKQIVPHDLDNIHSGQPLDMFPLWPVKALPEHSSSLIWVPRQSGPGGSRSREGVRKRGQGVR